MLLLHSLGDPKVKQTRERAIKATETRRAKDPEEFAAALHAMCAARWVKTPEEKAVDAARERARLDARWIAKVEKHRAAIMEFSVLDPRPPWKVLAWRLGVSRYTLVRLRKTLELYETKKGAPCGAPCEEK